MTDPTEVEHLAMSEVEKWEGFSAGPYQDSGGVWTIGYGSTRNEYGFPITATTPPITVDAARRLIVIELENVVLDLAAQVHTPLTLAEQVGFLDFVFNIGRGAFNASTMLKLWNRGDKAGAMRELETWDHVAGKVVRGLFLRRLDEERLFTQ
jgi:lysozyme